MVLNIVIRTLGVSYMVAITVMEERKKIHELLFHLSTSWLYHQDIFAVIT